MGAKQLFKSALTANDSTAQEATGTIRRENNAVYKYVKFSGTTAVAIGDCVCYVLSDTTMQTVDQANSAIAAGIAMAAAASGSASFGWIQVEGVTGANLSWTVPGAAGGLLTPVGATKPALAITAALTSLIVGVVVVPGAAGTGIISCAFPW